MGNDKMVVSWKYGAVNSTTKIQVNPPSQWTSSLVAPSCYNELFSDPMVGRLKMLEAVIDKSPLSSIRIAENTPFKLSSENIPYPPAPIRVGVTYFANLWVNPVSVNVGLNLILQQLKAFFIVTRDANAMYDLYVVVCGPSTQVINIETAIHHVAQGIVRPGNQLFIIHSEDNAHEYPGIYHLWTQRVHYPILLYFHSKGMSRYRGGGRERREQLLMQKVIAPWLTVLTLFQWFVSIDKIGASCSQEGFMWHNVFWVRSSYLECVEEPIRTDRRHYYEDWIARVVQPHVSIHPSHERPLTNHHYQLSYTNCFALCTPRDRCHMGEYRSPADCLHT